MICDNIVSKHSSPLCMTASPIYLLSFVIFNTGFWFRSQEEERLQKIWEKRNRFGLGLGLAFTGLGLG